MYPSWTSIYCNTLVIFLILMTILGFTGCQELRHISQAGLSPQTEDRMSPSTILVPQPQDTQFFDVLGTRADTQLAQCRNLEGCNQAHFLKGLTTLHSNTELAGYHFKKVVESSPHNRLGQASRVWLWLLHELRPSKFQTASAKEITRELVQALIQRDLDLLEELPIQTTVSSDLKSHLLVQEAKVKALSEQIHELSQEVATLNTKSASMHSLQQHLHARNKKVAELTSQLDALRRIDQELKEKAPPTTPSEKILIPKEEKRDNP